MISRLTRFPTPETNCQASPSRYFSSRSLAPSQVGRKIYHQNSLYFCHRVTVDQLEDFCLHQVNDFEDRILTKRIDEAWREIILIKATPDGPACCWWLLAVLPVDPKYQLSVLSMMSLKERLLKIQYILTYLQSIPSE